MQNLAKSQDQKDHLRPIKNLQPRLPALEPITSPWMRQLLEQTTVLNQLVQDYGSPVNVHNLGPFHENYKAYQAVFDEYGLEHLVLFARKANKCRAFVKAADRHGFGVDTASYRELKESLELGVDPTKLVVTAAVKNEKLLRLALRYDVLIIIDNQDECEYIQHLAKESGNRARVGFRVSGFEYAGEKLYSRFGFDIDRIFDFIVTQLGYTGCCEMLDYEGLHFHLNGYSTEQRGAALHACIDLAEQLRMRGFKTKFIDMGGGLLINYLKDKRQWEYFDRSLRLAVRGERSPITFSNNGLGYEMIDGELNGEKKVYPYYNENAKADFLRSVLKCNNDKSKIAATRLKENGIQLRIEPGRSLLDQCGMTIAKVAFRKEDSRGDLLVGLEMNMTQMYSSSADFMLDPFVIHQNKEKARNPVEAYFTGAYCLERDVLLKRKIQLSQYPEIGDLVVFVNTAGYMMHFFESEAHLFELAQNVIHLANSNTNDEDLFVTDQTIE